MMAMASKMKPWRDAVTLILTAYLGRSVAASHMPSATRPSSPTLQGSADLDQGYIKKVANTQEEKPKKKILPITFDYSTLLLTRNVHRNTLFAGSHVFPGGAIDKADFSPRWMELFGQAGLKHPADFGQMVSLHRDRPPVLQNKSDSPVPADVAFRICAIRETFEESGILLLRSINDCRPYFDSSISDKSDTPFGAVFNHTNLTDAEVKSWRDAAHRDASKFLQLCQTFQVLPDIWALAEWSNWLTPSDIKNRFDTMFYMCSLDSFPVTKHDEQETIHSQWMTPLDALVKYAHEEIYLPPPQNYELQRMCHYGKQRALHQFISDRAYLGCQRFLWVRLNSRDGVLSILPGDDLYPDNPVLHHLKSEDILTTEQTIKEASRSSTNLHRCEFRTVIDYELLTDYTIRFNVKLPYGHIGPKQIFVEEDLSSKS